MSEKPYGWIDDFLPRSRHTRKYTQHEPLLYPRFPDTDVPVPAEPTPCLAEPDNWFVSSSTTESTVVKRVCGSCWMVVECREYGLANPQLDGIWGGLSHAQRMARRKPASRGA